MDYAKAPEMIDYINRTLSGYQTSIENLNKDGLFDNARLYELFAQDICFIWFGKKFINLNTFKKNYPYVDLASEDGELYVQVSTSANIPAKVTDTLNKIKNSTDGRCKNIKRLVFFMLGSEKDLDFGPSRNFENKIFNNNEDIITIPKIIDKAQTDTVFLKALYSLLSRSENDIDVVSKSLNTALDKSKSFWKTYSPNIAGEYHIDRSDYLKKIGNDFRHFVVVKGPAGSGKTELCREICLQFNRVLCTRCAPLRHGTIDDIWGFSFQNCMRYLSGLKVAIYIDALEFADDFNAIENLDCLLRAAHNFNNVTIITSCRSRELSNFQRLMDEYSPFIVEVNLLDCAQIKDIAHHFSNRKIFDCKRFSSLLINPFYLNVLLSDNRAENDFLNGTAIRRIIWERIICLKDKCKSLNIKFNEICKVVQDIVLKRAKLFLPGVDDSEVDSDVLRALVGNGVLTEENGKVRLKEDIYEDICFEMLFEKTFDECHRNVNEFYKFVDGLGRSGYRRFQIWISDVLIDDFSISKYLEPLLCKTKGRQLQDIKIGIIKSENCELFFKKYRQELNDSVEELGSYIRIVNIYGFDLDVDNSWASSVAHTTVLTPSGVSRDCLIQIVYNTEFYKIAENIDQLLKMFFDYSKGKYRIGETEHKICKMLEYFMSAYLKNSYADSLSIECIKIFSYYSKYDPQWTASLFDYLWERYQDSNRSIRGIFQKLIVTIFSPWNGGYLSKCREAYLILASRFLSTPDKKEGLIHYSTADYEKYGISSGADALFTSGNINNSFYHLLFINKGDILKNLQWALELTNKLIEYRAADEKWNKNVSLFIDGKNYDYYGSQELYLGCYSEYSLPHVIGDLVYQTKQSILDVARKAFEKNQNSAIAFCEEVKSLILTNSNNVLFFPIICEIGIVFEREIPGYSLDLAGSLKIIEWDITRSVIVLSDFINRRYKNKQHPLLREYFLQAQFVSPELRDRCRYILERLKSLYPNDEKHCEENLDIQLMDIRNCHYETKDNKIYLTQEVNAKTEKFYNKKYNEYLIRDEDSRILEDVRQIDFDVATEEDIKDAINRILEARNKSPRKAIIFDLDLQKCIVALLKKDDIDNDLRDRLISIWIDELLKLTSNNEKTFFNQKQSSLLFKQIEKNLNVQVKKKLLFLIVKIYTSGENINESILASSRDELYCYLKTNAEMAKRIFDFELALAEDSMKHQVFNANVLKDEGIEFKPNLSMKTLVCDRRVKEKGISTYSDNWASIFDKYIIDGKEYVLDCSKFKLENYDITLLIQSLNCGLDIKNKNLHFILEKIIEILPNICAIEDYETRVELIGQAGKSYFSRFVASCLKGGLDDGKEVIDCVIRDESFKKFNEKIEDIFLESFSILSVLYFDAYKDPNKRRQFSSIYKELALRIEALSNQTAKKEMSKLLVFGGSKYHPYGLLKNCGAGYSKSDRKFVADFDYKYGRLNPDEMLKMVYEYKTDLLMPEILVPLALVVSDSGFQSEYLKHTRADETYMLKSAIYEAYFKHKKEIMSDATFIDAFEKLPESLVGLGFRDAAVILDSFRLNQY